MSFVGTEIVVGSAQKKWTSCTVQLLVRVVKVWPGPSLGITDHISSTDLACCVTKPLPFEVLSKLNAVIGVAWVSWKRM
jgi:hypothetical protein